MTGRTPEPLRIRLGAAGNEAILETFLDGRLEVLSPRGVRGPDRPLLESLAGGLEGRVLVAGSREGVAALASALLFPEARVEAFGMDAYETHRAREALDANGAPSVGVRLAADLPADGSLDWVLLPLSRAGDAMLAGEMIREAHAALKPRGKLLAATDNPRDRWLHDRVVDVFDSATIHLRGKSGSAYIARKQQGREPRPRDFRRSFRARLLGREIVLESRPGVFSHGEVDDGTRALAEAAPLREDSRVIDLGCGSGALGIAAALAAPRGRALLCDSNVRSTRVARANAVRNGAAGNALVLLAFDLSAVPDGSFDLVLANPPYYSDHRITKLFARDARRVLEPGGRLLLVTKAPERPAEILRALFGRSKVEERRGYAVLEAIKVKRPPPGGVRVIRGR